jgi:hypothetical protein
VTPVWLTVLSWCALGVALVCAAMLIGDIFVRGYRQRMPVMEWVWPVTALYLGPLAVWGYARFGRPQSRLWQGEHRVETAPAKPGWATVAVGVSHCGAGCTMGDVVAEFAIFFLGLRLLDETLYAEYVGDFVLAVLLGLVFQYFAVAPMRGLGVRDGLVAAAKADLVSLVAFEIGLFAWMAVQALVLFRAPHELRPDSPVYWFGMQIGMAIGFATSYPVNVWLIRRGIKEAM